MDERLEGAAPNSSTVLRYEIAGLEDGVLRDRQTRDDDCWILF